MGWRVGGGTGVSWWGTTPLPLLVQAPAFPCFPDALYRHLTLYAYPSAFRTCRRCSGPLYTPHASHLPYTPPYPPHLPYASMFCPSSVTSL